MKKKSFFLILLVLFPFFVKAQLSYKIDGVFSNLNNKEIILKSYNSFEQIVITKTVTDSIGNFTLNYPANYIGASIIEVKDGPRFILLLNKENIILKWSDTTNPNDLKVLNSKENDILLKGLELYKTSETKLSGLIYLKPLYEKDEKSSFKNREWIISQIKIEKEIFPNYLKKLHDSCYAKFYINLSRFITDMPLTASRYGERISENEAEFNSIDFSNYQLINSGLYQDLLESYFILMESYGENSYEHLNRSIDIVLKSLNKNPSLKQTVAEYMFRLLEKRSSFNAAEYLALKMLEDDSNSCQVNESHKALFEQYRKMAKGKIAPEIKFDNSISNYSKLSDIKNKYRLIVFGASWCNKCVEEIPKLFNYYKNWKKQYDIEVALISLDKNKDSFEKFTKDFTWISSCDFKEWEGITAKDYCVFGTPTMYLLDQENKIILKPISTEQVDAWLKVFK
jgi:thiol-disulfide isomerase/thioredoxin